MTEIFKIKYELAPQITDSMFERKNKPYSLRNFQELLTEAKRTCIMVLQNQVIGLRNYGFFYQKNIKKDGSLEILKRKVKQWICDNCPCRLCKPHFQNIIFL